MNLIDLLDRESVPLKSFLAMLGMRHQEHNLRALSLFCDEEQAVTACDLMRGHYLRFPSGRAVDELKDELALVTRWKLYQKAARGGTLREVSDAWRSLLGIARSLRLPLKQTAIKEHAQKISAELRDALKWATLHDVLTQEKYPQPEHTEAEYPPGLPVPAPEPELPQVGETL